MNFVDYVLSVTNLRILWRIMCYVPNGMRYMVQVGGRVVKYEGLTFVTVRGAGHLVPLNKPAESLSLINSFLSGQDLPTQK